MSARPAARRTPVAMVSLLVVGMLVMGAAVSGYLVYVRPRADAAASPQPTTTASSTSSPSSSASPQPTSTPTRTVPTTFPRSGPGTYVYAPGQSGVIGTAGTLKKYKVAVETGIPVTPEDFAAQVDTTLADPRSWIAGRNVRLQRVPSSASANFTVYLITAGTAEKLCRAGGFDIVWHGEPYSSCSLGGRVLINLTRYLTAIPDYGTDLLGYQQYAINHEVGHALGHGHELCPGTGKPAPVMQQQTFGMHGCTPYSWPYLDGKRYAGAPGTIRPMG